MSGLSQNPQDNPPETPDGSWEEAPAFREIFLAQFSPEAAAAFRQAGRHLYEAALETTLTELEEPWVRTRVRALAKDLRFSAEVFATLAADREEGALDAEDRALCMKAESWAAEVLALVRGIESAIGPERKS